MVRSAKVGTPFGNARTFLETNYLELVWDKLGSGTMIN